MMPRCITCGDAVSGLGRALHRLNWKGHPAVWACDEHWPEAKACLFPEDDPTRRDPCLPVEDPDHALRDLGPWTGGVTNA